MNVTVRAAALNSCQRLGVGGSDFILIMAPGLTCSISAAVQIECKESKNSPVTPNLSTVGGKMAL